MKVTSWLLAAQGVCLGLIIMLIGLGCLVNEPIVFAPILVLLLIIIWAEMIIRYEDARKRKG